MRNVDGPDDVKPGDLVEHNDHGFRSTLTICEVVKVSATRLTVMFPGASKATQCGYTKKYRTSVGRHTRLMTGRTFRKLEPRDIWWRQKPRAEGVEVVSGGYQTVASIVVLPEALRDLPELNKSLAFVAHWLATEPKDGAA